MATRALTRRRISPTVVEAKGIVIEGPVALIPANQFLRSALGSSFSNGMKSPYANHAWVYAAIRALALNISGLQYKLTTGDEDNPKVITDSTTGPRGQLWDIFDHPNRMMSGSGFWEAIVIHLNLDGMCFVVLDRAHIAEIPKQMMPFGSRFFEPIYNADRTIHLGWMFRGKNGEQVPLRHDQLCIVRFYNPDDPIMGLAPLQAAMRGVRLDYLAGIYNEAFFESNADPGGVITYDRQLTEKQAKEILSRWEERHRGAANTKKIGILYGGGKYTSTGMSQKDMEFIKQREWTKSEILAVFKTPETEISQFKDVNRANAFSQDRAFWTKTLIPICRIIQSAFRIQLIRPLRDIVGRGLTGEFDLSVVEALQEILNDKIRNAQILYQIGVPINVINQRLNLGLPRIEWGDMWYPNRSVAPITDIISGKVNGAKPSGPSQSQEPDTGDNPAPEDDGTADDATDDTAEDSIQDIFITTVVPAVSNAVTQVLRGVLWSLRKRALRAVERGEELIDPEEWRAKLIQRITPITQALTIGAKEALGLDLSLDTNSFGAIIDVAQSMLYAIPADGGADEQKAAVRSVLNQVGHRQVLEGICQREIAGPVKALVTV